MTASTFSQTQAGFPRTQASHAAHKARAPLTRSALPKRPLPTGSILHYAKPGRPPLLARGHHAKHRAYPLNSTSLAFESSSSRLDDWHGSASCIAADVALMGLIVGVMGATAYVCSLFSVGQP